MDVFKTIKCVSLETSYSLSPSLGPVMWKERSERICELSKIIRETDVARNALLGE